MDRTAGFAASVTVRQRLFQDLARVLYNAGALSRRMSFAVPVVSADIFLAVPGLVFNTANGNRLALDLYGWGPMTVTPPGGIPESRRVKLRMRVLVPLAVSLANRKLVIKLTAADATVTSLQIDPYTGGLFSAPTVAYLQSPDFMALLVTGVRFGLGQMGDLIPPLQADFLGAIAADPTATVTSRVLNEVLALGVDVDRRDPMGTSIGRTHGNPVLLVDTTVGNDVAMWTHPLFIPQAFPDVRQKVREAVEKADGTLNEFDLHIEEGWLSISGNASGSGGAVNFSLRAVPRLIRPGTHFEFDDEYGEHFDLSTPDREELWFEPTAIHVDIDRDWWVIVLEGLGALLAGLGYLVVEAILDMVRGNVVSGIEQNDGSRGARNQQFTIPGVSRPTMQLRIETVECHADGMFSGITIKPQYWWWATMDGPKILAVEEALVETLQFRIGLPPDAFTDDPELRVSWTLRRTDTNAILRQVDSAISVSALRFQFDGSDVPFLEVAQLAVEWRVYRPLGVGVDEIFSGLQYTDIVDYVDRSHRFVHWEHEVDLPVVQVLPDGGQLVKGRIIKLRRSKLHRTSIPGRCQMLRNYSTTRLTRPDQPSYPLLYLDDLPFPVDDILTNRRQLCDYCFFGGPDKDVPLPF